MRNKERIRNMSTKELAKLIFDVLSSEKDNQYSDEYHLFLIEDWLEQETED